MREINFYYTAVTLSDSLYGLLLAVCALVGWRSGRDASQVTAFFEDKWACHAAYGFGSARSALYFLLDDLRSAERDEVLITGFTCEVVANAVIQAGLKPVYVDINPQTYAMAPDAAANLLTERTLAVIVQHTFGIVAPTQELIDLARAKGAVIIEDCALSLGSKAEGKLTGTSADAAIFTFELSKTVTSGHGGILIINNPELNSDRLCKRYEAVSREKPTDVARELFQTSICGVCYKPAFVWIGKYLVYVMFRLGVFRYSSTPEEKKAARPSNYLLRLPWLKGALVIRQLERLAATLAVARNQANYYYAHLHESLVSHKHTNQSDGQVLIRFPVLVGQRKVLADSLTNAGIEAGLWFSAPLSDETIDHSLFGYCPGDCPVSEQTGKQILNLPLGTRVRTVDLKKIVELVNQHQLQYQESPI